MPRSSSPPDEAPVELAALEVRIAEFARNRGASLADCSPSRASYRRTYRIGDAWFAKSFAPAARDRYERERGFLAGALGDGRAPELVEASFDDAAGGYLVMTALAGAPLDALLPSFSAGEFLEMLSDLGRCIGAVHAIPLDRAAPLARNALEAERRKHFDQFEDAAAELRAARLLAPETLARMREAVGAARDVAFATPWHFLHGDVHRDNVFAARRGGRWACALIDFEASGPNPLELEFAYPFLSIVGEAFPGRRLAACGEAAWRAFGEAYASRGTAMPGLDLVAGHAIAWFTWVAAHSHRAAHPKSAAYAQDAVAALAFLEAHRAPCVS